jgi:PEGA domain
MLPLPFRLARKWLRTPPAREEIVPPIAVREVEERIPTIDELGNRRTVIRTRTLASFEGAAGVVEVEEARRYTLPGFGHVYPIANDEYVVFRNHMKLRADPQAAISSAVPATIDVLPQPEPHAAHPETLSSSMVAMQTHDGVRSKAFAAVASVVFVTLVIATLPPRNEPSSLLASFTAAAPSPGIDVTPNESAPAALPSMPLDESPPMASADAVSLVNDNVAAAPRSVARVAFAIRPWGEVYVNGKKQGPSPPIRELKLKPGRYTVEIRNGALPPYRGTIDLRTKAKTKVTHDFVKADPAAPKESGPSIAAVSRSQPRFSSDEWPR